jgi:hypothetical protein
MAAPLVRNRMDLDMSARVHNSSSRTGCADARERGQHLSRRFQDMSILETIEEAEWLG